MAIKPAPIVFEGEETGERLVLEGADLPDEPGLGGGVKPRTSEQTHAAGDVSVQWKGYELQEKSLEGTWSNTRQSWGEDNHARKQAKRARRLARSAQIVRYEYGGRQLWGFLSVETDEMHSAKIEYTLNFQPHWNDPPEGDLSMKFEPSPDDAGARIDASTQELVGSFTEMADDGSTSDSFAKKAMVGVQKGRSAIESVLSPLRKAQSVKRLSKRTLSTARRGVQSAIGSFLSVEKTIRETETAARAFARDVTTGFGLSDEEFTPTSGVYGGGKGISETKHESKARAASNQSRLTTAELLQIIREMERRETGEPTQRTYRVQRGDTLRSIADTELRDPSRWEEIAEVNDLGRPSSIEPGDVLILPPEEE